MGCGLILLVGLAFAPAVVVRGGEERDGLLLPVQP